MNSSKNQGKAVFQLLRVHQWIKNGFLFLPLFFDQQITNLECLGYTFIGFLAYSFTASALYVLNDYQDRETDRDHPVKKYRPIASGVVSPAFAFSFFLALLVFAVLLSLVLPIYFLLILAGYFILNLLYSYKLKHIPILDITLVAIGYVLRIFAGAVICSITPSVWIIVMTFLLALFIAMAKRRDDVLLFMESGTKSRKVIDGYNLAFLNNAMSIMASVVIVAYLMYTLSPEVEARLNTDKLYLSLLFVILGIMRYLQKALVEDDTGTPTEILYRDPFMQSTLLGWFISIGVILYMI